MPTVLSVNNYLHVKDSVDELFLEHNRALAEANWHIVPFSMKHERNFESSWSPFFVENIEYGGSYSTFQKALLAQKVIYSFEARGKLRKLLDKTHPDVCHYHNIYHHISPSVLSVSKALRIPSVMTLHDLKVACPAYHMYNNGVCERCKSNRVYNVLRYRCIKSSISLSAIIMMESILHRVLQSYKSNIDVFILPCKFYSKKLEEWGWDREKFVYVPNFVDGSRYGASSDLGSLFLYSGPLSNEKGVMTLVRAAARAKVQVVIAGTGSEEEKLKEEAIRLNADINFVGDLSTEKLHEAVRQACAVVLPSEWYENSPLAILKAYALGRPVVAADIGGIPEHVRNGETGLLFEAGSVEDLASALRKVAQMERSHLVEMGRAGRNLLEIEFSKELYRERISLVYQKIAGARACMP